MSDYKNEYQKFADSAVRGREKDEAFGRLRLGVFWGVAGALAIFLTRVLKDQFTPPRWMVMAMVGMAPLAVIVLIVNYIRMPNEYKASAPALMMGFVTLLGAGATIALAKFFDLFQIISP